MDSSGIGQEKKKSDLSCRPGEHKCDKELGSSMTLVCTTKTSLLHTLTPMPSTKAQKAAAARAWAAKSKKKTVEVFECYSDLDTPANEPEVNNDSEIECTGWNGGVNYVASDTDSDDEDWKDTDSDGGGAKSGEDNNKDLEGLEGEDLLDSLWNKWDSCSRSLKTSERPPHMNTS